MKVCEKIIKLIILGKWCLPMEIFIMEIWIMVKSMDKEPTSIMMVLFIKDFGTLIKNKVMETAHIVLEINSQETEIKIKKKGREYIIT